VEEVSQREMVVESPSKDSCEVASSRHASREEIEGPFGEAVSASKQKFFKKG